MDVVQMETDLLRALGVIYTAQARCEVNRFAEIKLASAASYLRDEHYAAMKLHFADPEPVEELCL